MINKLKNSIDGDGIGYPISNEEIIIKLNEVINEVNVLVDVFASANLLPIPEDEKSESD